MNDPFDALKGNEEQKEYFKTQILGGSLSHAYILEGEEGTGRHTLALCAAALLARDVPEGEKILRGISPDVTVCGVPRDKKIFPVDVVRKIKSDASIRPNELPFRCFILEDAGQMNVQAQNAALKLLEEPPANTYFFLLCENAALLLPTVRSRAPVIRMQRFSNEELKRLLLREGVPQAAGASAERLDAAVKSAAGSYGKALAALTKTGDDAQTAKIKKVLACLGEPQKANLLLAVTALPQKRQEFDEALSDLLTALRDMLLARSRGREEDLMWFSDMEEARRCAAHLTKNALLAMYARTVEIKDQVNKNINMQNAALALASGLYAAAAK